MRAGELGYSDAAPGRARGCGRALIRGAARSVGLQRTGCRTAAAERQALVTVLAGIDVPVLAERREERDGEVVAQRSAHRRTRRGNAGAERERPVLRRPSH